MCTCLLFLPVWEIIFKLKNGKHWRISTLVGGRFDCAACLLLGRLYWPVGLQVQLIYQQRCVLAAVMAQSPIIHLKELYYCPSGGLYACNWMGTYFAMGSTGSGDEVGQCILDDLFVPKLIQVDMQLFWVAVGSTE